MRAILVGVRNSVQAIWQAIMLISSLEVSATIMSAPWLPAASSTAGCAALPQTVRMSRRSCRSRSDVVAGVDDRDVVGLLAGELLGGRAPDLARTENDDFQVVSQDAAGPPAMRRGF